jgi:hypothetical protein
MYLFIFEKLVAPLLEHAEVEGWSRASEKFPDLLRLYRSVVEF